MFDTDAAMRGSVPWNAEECLEVMHWYHELINKPKDDWDLRERRVDLEHDDGKVTRMRLNQFNAMNQLGLYMADRYGESEMPYHSFRFMQIMDFLTNHTSELFAEGLARTSEDGGYDIRQEVVRALCELPYTQLSRSDKGFERRRFVYGEVVLCAKELRNTDP